jgi:hypothetical protein
MNEVRAPLTPKSVFEGLENPRLQAVSRFKGQQAHHDYRKNVNMRKTANRNPLCNCNLLISWLFWYSHKCFAELKNTATERRLL